MESTPAYLLHKLVYALDRAADRELRAHLGISYKRALFLLVLQAQGTLTQHELALALGYSDPAVSTMLLTLARDGYVTTLPSPAHGRKRLVTITPQGSELVARGTRMMDAQFDHLLAGAGVDGEHYRALTEQLYRALVAKLQQEQP